MSGGRLLAAALALASANGVAGAQPTPAPRQTPQAVVVRCHVAEGPRLERCSLPTRANLTDEEATRVIQHLEERKPCLLPGLKPGQTKEWRETFHTPFPPDKLVMLTMPDWAERPTAAMMMRHSPQSPKARESGGQAVITCMASLEGRAKDCQVVAERPEGLGFGADAIAASRDFRLRPMMRNCEPIDGGKMRLPFVFPPR